MLIKHTKSLSPVSGKVIDAQVIEEDGKVYLAKEGKKYLIENNADFYKMMIREYPEKQLPATHIAMYVSDECNMNCPFCYEKERDKKEPSLEKIKKIISKHKGSSISFSGKEPTLRKELLDIIKFTREKGNYPHITTNGLTLADYDYVLKLKKAGIWYVVFAINGDEVKPILDKKLKALSNLKRAGIKTVLSVMITKGSNENFIKKIYDYAIQNRSFVSEIRTRPQVSLKNSKPIDSYCMSEFVDLVTGQLRLNKKDVLTEYYFKEEILKFLSRFKSKYSIVVQNEFRSRLCHFLITVYRGKSVGGKINLERVKRSGFWLLYYLIKAYGIRYILEKFVYPFMGVPNWLKNKDIIQILLRRWSDIYTIDLERNKECVFRYYTSNDYETEWGTPFCLSTCL